MNLHLPTLEPCSRKSGLNPFPHNETFLTGLGKKLFKTVGKEENVGKQHFLIFPQCFLLYIKDRNFHLYYICFVFCKCFQVGQGQIFVVWEWVNASSSCMIPKQDIT